MRHARYHVTLVDGSSIGYALSPRSGVYRLSFTDPTGQRKQVSTGARSLADAHLEARRLIAETYRRKPREKVTLSTALDGIAGLRPDTLRGYRCALSALSRLLPRITSPEQVTPELAHTFKRLALAQVSPVSVRTYLRSLRSLWAAHFLPSGYVTSNPWLEVRYPEVTSCPARVPPEAHLAAFLRWIAADPLAALFVRVKLLAGCRTWDLCQARTEDLADGSLVLRASASKVRRERVVPIPTEMYAELQRVAGEDWLWGGYDSRFTFTPKTWYWRISALFKRYNREHPEARIRPHDLRKRAITLLSQAVGVDAAANAIGVDVQTARRYYLDAQRAFDGKGVMEQAARILDCTQTVPETR